MYKNYKIELFSKDNKETYVFERKFYKEPTLDEVKSLLKEMNIGYGTKYCCFGYGKVLYFGQ